MPAAGLTTPWSGRGWPARQLPAAADRLGAEDGEARRGEAAVAGCGPAVASSGGKSSWRKEEERGRGTGRPWSAARRPWQRQAPVGRESRRREGKGEGESEWELLRGSVGLQLEEKASWRAARVHGGHPAASRLHGRPPNSKFKNSETTILPRKYA